MSDFGRGLSTLALSGMGVLRGTADDCTGRFAAFDIAAFKT
jgi:hypothetical protein